MNGTGSRQCDQRANRLLALLDAPTRAALGPRLEPVPLVLRQNLYEEDGPMTHAWFPAEGVLSMLAATSAAQTRIEVATIGPEGMLGVPLLLGGRRSPGIVFPQVEGHGWRMGAEDFLDAVRRYPDFGGVMHRYACALLVQVAQGTACNRAHDVAQRCARWLLQTHDRVAGDTLELTQDFLAEMLGERRATVNQVATSLQQRGLIRYSRGRIVITDRPGLEATACGCYGFVRDQFAQLLSAPAPGESRSA
jgi:CRP-like cAMP-binding protein